MFPKTSEIGKRMFIIVSSILLVATILWSTSNSSSKYENDSRTESRAPVGLDVLSKLTMNTWRYSSQSTLQPEGFVLSFFFDGTFKWSVVSDHSEVRAGVWGYKELGKGVGLLFLLTKGNSTAVGVSPSQKEEVFLLKLMKDNLLRLGRYSLRPAGPPPAQTGQLSSSAIKEVINDKNFPNYFRLIAQPWSRLGTKDNDFIPDLLSLQRDGTFTASYRKAECRHSGYWSLEGGQLFFELPPDHCDARGYRNPIVRGHYYTFENGSLVLDLVYRYSTSD